MPELPGQLPLFDLAPSSQDVTHAHGQHTWHTHSGADYAAHQRPIKDELIASSGDGPVAVEVS